jgi:hypothetical protein
MEKWNNGMMGNNEIPLKPNFPIFHYSNTPDSGYSTIPIYLLC